MPSRERSESSATASELPQSKRVKHRACDYCRSHRIKCVTDDGQDTCQRCVMHGIPCEKFRAPPKDERPRRRLLFKSSAARPFQGLEARYLGSSSFAQLAWKHSPQGPDVVDRFNSIDDRHDCFRGSVGGTEDDGVLLAQPFPTSSSGERNVILSFKMAEAKLAEKIGSGTTLRALYETCRDRIIPIFPVISVTESILAENATQDHVHKYAAIDSHSTPPTPLPQVVRLIHCALASLSREVPAEIRDNVLEKLLALLPGPEMSEISRIDCLGSIQVLLLLSMSDELNGADSGSGAAAVWRNVGTATRMASAIGLHRNVSTNHIPFFQLNRRFRVWGACIATDTWLSVRTGRSLGIDLAECDAPKPRHFADGIREGIYEERPQAVYPCFRFLAEFTSLSVLLGQTYRLTTPMGLRKADDISLLLLETRIDLWVAQLPATWPYSVRLTLDQAPSLLNVFIVAVEFTLQRTFLWPTGVMPAHITYRPSPARWAALLARAEQAVQWFSTSEGALYLDVWSAVLYPAVVCVIIALKALEQTKDRRYRTLLQAADKVIQDWAAQRPRDSLRSRYAALSSLLCAAGVEESATTITVDEFFSPECSRDSGSLGVGQYDMADATLQHLYGHSGDDYLESMFDGGGSFVRGSGSGLA